MNIRHFLASLVVALACLGGGYLLGQRLPAAPAVVAAAVGSREPAGEALAIRRENASLKADVARLTTELAARNAELAAKAAVPAAAPAPPPNPAVAAAEARAKALADGLAFFADFPEAKDILRGIGRAQFGRNFVHLQRFTTITPAQFEELENQFVEFMLASPVLVQGGGITPGSVELPEAQGKAILGEQGYQQYLDYRRMLPLVGFASEISNLSAREPLSPEQSGRLVKTLADASAAYQSGARADNQSIDWNHVFTEARTFLSPAQMSVLQAQGQAPRLQALSRQFFQNQGK